MSEGIIVDVIARAMFEDVAGESGWTLRSELTKDIYRADAACVIRALSGAGYRIVKAPDAISWCPTCHGYPDRSRHCPECGGKGTVPA